ncbi:formate dehydrogenase subunit gamma [Vibrio sp. JPW-9-11-11]|uniref:formate dehydrogenase subunit gamma n=1 Tax=Vibrio sp. JPW-9-11-11 TaxID=1416532 RepID=UPI001593F580|nr:formate dehydrogenase subunit gamma [Vibrio sp. JPW-9-11-11]NVD06676.1 formate dehydrogenase subunit gamma [Vibrio sp. JPW-9-11-11]
MFSLFKRASLAMLSLLAALSFAWSLPAYAEQSESQVAQREMTQLAGADFWRQVRQGEEGYTTSQFPEHGTLISAPGQAWYILKEKWMSPAGAVAIFGSIALVTLMYLVVGPIMLSAPRTGRKIKRWSRLDRALHWSMAFTFLTLAFSGLMLVYGKHFLKPYIPADLWGFIIMLAKQYHNYIGPIFYVLLLCVLVKWWRKSIFRKVDLHWFMKLGGMVGKHKGSHPSAEFSNAGEKALFWMLIVVGSVVALSGLVLDFPIFGQTRRDMEMSNLVHMIAALILICGFVFHIYIGLFGMEGALEGMVTGEVDETWAKEHHDLWYHEVMEQEKQEQAAKTAQRVEGVTTNEQTS